ncbi:MAG TPA: hypothetical protein VF526_06290 [Solirubrobacteraceae bacterium]|jgi:hypothetical protein
MTARLTCLLVLSAGLLSACGGGDGESSGQGRTAPAEPPAVARDPLALPAYVPTRSEGGGERRAIEVIRGWSEALRLGDIDRASSFWGLPAKIQNATPVLTLRSRDDVRAFNLSLTCGAILTAAGKAKEFTILNMRLAARRGADCGSGVGRPARTAIRVQRDKIVEWYRLPDDPQEPRPAPPREPPTAPLPNSSPVI